MRNVFMRALNLRGHEFDLALCGANANGQVKSGDILIRSSRGYAAMHNLPGPWDCELQARASILEKAREIAKQYS